MIFKGLNTSTTTYIPAEDLKNAVLENCSVGGGKIENRKGFSFSPKDLIFKLYGSEDFENTFKITDCYMFLDGEYGRVAILISDNREGVVTYRMLFISSSGKSKLLGNIEFSSNGEDFGYPVSFTVFKGRPTKGRGVYLMVRRVYNVMPDFIEIRELDNNNSFWAMLSDSDIYAPLVLANGRGESYHTLIFEGKELGLPAPIMPESKNLLGTRFRAAYTTDGMSFAFSLPFTRLDNEQIDVSMLYKGENYSFKIAKGERQSGEVQIGENTIILYLDRPVGRMYFGMKSGARWSPEFTGEINNICVNAGKTDTESRKKISSMRASSTIDGSMPFGKDVATVFYDNLMSPSLISLNSPSEPLYFPENLSNALGDAEKPVIYATHKDGKLLAFKDGEMYSAKVETTTAAKKITLLGETTEISETVCSLNKTADFAAAPKPSTFHSFSGSVLFQGEDNSVWAVNGEAKVEKVAETEQGFDFATVQKDKYILLKGNKAAVLQKGAGGYIKGMWTLPHGVAGAFSYLGNSVFVFGYQNGEDYLLYPALYGGETDFCLMNEYYGCQKAVTSKISVSLKSAKRKPVRLYKITVDGSGRQAGLTVFEGEKKVAERKTDFKNGRAQLYVGAAGESLTAELSFKGKTTVFGIVTEQNEKS
ncbi:MAG: hypothetical protein IIW94_03760 [Clostridia bacterium]|nr:hypothetical protein [Clostridia bacterium]